MYYRSNFSLLTSITTDNLRDSRRAAMTTENDFPKTSFFEEMSFILLMSTLPLMTRNTTHFSYELLIYLLNFFVELITCPSSSTSLDELRPPEATYN